jgi:hypothetical protein
MLSHHCNIPQLRDLLNQSSCNYCSCPKNRACHLNPHTPVAVISHNRHLACCFFTTFTDSKTCCLACSSMLAAIIACQEGDQLYKNKNGRGKRNLQTVHSGELRCCWRSAMCSHAHGLCMVEVEHKGFGDEKEGNKR